MPRLVDYEKMGRAQTSKLKKKIPTGKLLRSPFNPLGVGIGAPFKLIGAGRKALSAARSAPGRGLNIAVGYGSSKLRGRR